MRTPYPVISLLALALCACDSSETNPQTQTEAVKGDRVHERSFSWNEGFTGNLQASTRTQETRFDTPLELREAAARLEAKLRVPDFADSLWKPVDYACDELELALWNVYGKIRIGDSLILDEKILKSHCRSIGEGYSAATPLKTAATANPSESVMDRQFPYKMIGTSWSKFNLGIYASTGAETQFKKSREKLGITAWYDTDAARLGVRTYLFDCIVQNGLRICWQRASKSDFYANDDYVSVREFAAGMDFDGNSKDLPVLGVPVASWTPAALQARLDALQDAFHAGLGSLDLRPFLGDFQTFTRALGIKIPLVGTVRFRVAEGVLSFHSADHAGMRFRAVSSSGLGDINSALTVRQFDFVTW